jgi:tetratricopeptide (TPR) repeat protein
MQEPMPDGISVGSNHRRSKGIMSFPKSSGHLKSTTRRNRAKTLLREPSAAVGQSYRSFYPKLTRFKSTLPTTHSPNQVGLETLSQDDRNLLLRQQAISKAQAGAWIEALELFDLLIRRDSSNASDYSNRGLVYFKIGDLDQALENYNQALSLNSRLAKVYNNRANCYASMGNLAAAIADYDQAIDLNPFDLHPRINQGITLRDLGAYQRAVEVFDLALQFSKLGNASDMTNTLVGHIYAERGRTHHLLGDWNCAMSDYQQALAILTTDTGSYRLQCQVGIWLSELLDCSAIS